MHLVEDTYRKSLPPELADQLNFARLHKRLTIRSGAERCGISRSHFGHLVLGKRAPSVQVALRLIRGLELNEAIAVELMDHAVEPRW